jgi:hypothetical protein
MGGYEYSESTVQLIEAYLSLPQPLAFLLIKEISKYLSKSLSSNLDDVGSKSQDVSLCLEDIMEKLRHAFPSVRSSDVTANTLLAS